MSDRGSRAVCVHSIDETAGLNPDGSMDIRLWCLLCVT
jgi:hypothetical protein